MMREAYQDYERKRSQELGDLVNDSSDDEDADYGNEGTAPEPDTQGISNEFFQFRLLARVKYSYE
eukprot:7411651-Karenia_brevis.AAC.1